MRTNADFHLSAFRIHTFLCKFFSFPGSLFSASLGRRLVTWPPVTQIFPRGLSQRITFVDLKWSERKSIAGQRHTGKYMSLKFSKLHLGQTKYIYIYAAYWTDFN